MLLPLDPLLCGWEWGCPALTPAAFLASIKDGSCIATTWQDLAPLRPLMFCMSGLWCHSVGLCLPWMYVALAVVVWSYLLAVWCL